MLQTSSKVSLVAPVPISLNSSPSVRCVSTGDDVGSPGRSHSPQESRSPLGGKLKRSLDVGIALISLLSLLPLLLMLCALIRVTSPGPIIFGHRRVGFGGRMFRCWKFRSMAVNGDEILKDYLAKNPGAAMEWQETFKLRMDPRVTRVGRFLRKSSLDEIPQLLNVLRGEMSCVGPRPIVQDELERYGLFAKDYLETRPGLTGIWQTSGRSNTSYAKRVRLDSEYVRNWSLRGDLKILLMTIPALLKVNETD